MSTEENKMIAEFMGAEILITSSGREIYRFYDNEGDICEAGGIDRLDYGSSWDWLMPVVEKIHDECKLPEYTYGLKFLMNLSIFCGKKVLLQAVVKFIKWYNSINEQK